MQRKNEEKTRKKERKTEGKKEIKEKRHKKEERKRRKKKERRPKRAAQSEIAHDGPRTKRREDEEEVEIQQGWTTTAADHARTPLPLAPCLNGRVEFVTWRGETRHHLLGTKAREP